VVQRLLIKVSIVFNIMKIKFFFLAVSFLLFAFTMSAKITLPSIFSDNMVLQQQSEVLVWGRADANKTVSVRNNWDSKSKSVTSAADGSWKLKLETPVAGGGPYEIVISDGEEITLKNVLIGEVWLCSGQSNMDIPMKGVGKNVTIKDAEKYIAEGKNPQLRLFKVEHNQSEVPLTDVKGSWLEATPESVAGFSAVGYLFGKQLQEALGVPVGMIKSAVGGTTIAAWMSEKLLRESFGIQAGSKAGKANATELFNAMISPLAGYAIKGFLWYQGEGNHGASELYARLLPAMVNEWRTIWGLGELPFYYAQIAPYNYRDGKSPYMRQLMAECMKTIPNSGMVTLTDAGEEDNIHPKDKKVVADRFLNWVLAKTYNKSGIGYCGPIYNSLEIKDKKVTVKFDYAETGLTTFGNKLQNFEIAGSDTIYVPAKAKISKQGTVQVWNNSIKNPVAIRYAFKDYVKGELFNNYGLPASSFQTLQKRIK